MNHKSAFGLAAGVVAAFLTPRIATAKDYGAATVNGYSCTDSDSIGYVGDMTLNGHYPQEEGRAHIAQMLMNNGFENVHNSSSEEFPILTIKKHGSGLLVHLSYHNGSFRRRVFQFTLERPQKSYEDLLRLEALMPRSCSLYRETPEEARDKAALSDDIIVRAQGLYFESAEERKERLLMQSKIIFDKGIDPGDVYLLVTEGMPEPAPKYRMGIIPNPWSTPEGEAREFVEDRKEDDAFIVRRIQELDTTRDSRLSLDEMVAELGKGEVQKNFRFPGRKMLKKYQTLRSER